METTAVTSKENNIEEEVIRIRKEKIVHFLKHHFDAIVYVALAIIVYLSVKIRTANLAGLRDITTGGWTLGPDLDPFLFLRWTEYIVEHGKIMAMDMMRYVPLGFDTSRELVLHPYMIAWFHKIAVFFGSQNVMQSAVLYPVFMFGLSVIAFFLMTRKIFESSLGKEKANAIALIASFFLSVFTSLIPRTVAGIPEKEASGILFLFLAFYFFLVSWDAQNKMVRYLFGVLAGTSTAIMGLVWGGYSYILVTIAPTVFLAFLLGKVDKRRFISYALWVICSFLLLLFLTERYSFMDLVTSVTNGPAVFVLFFGAIYFIMATRRFDTLLKKSKFSSLPRPILVLILTLILSIIIISVFVGPTFIPNKIISLKNLLITPVVDRLNLTVAENRQPFFTEWEASFGPHVRGIALTFWLFFFGSVCLFYRGVRTFKKKDRMIVSFAYFILLVSLVFSRYSSESRFNGTNGISLSFYALGPLIFIITFGSYYYKYYKSEGGRLSGIEFNLIFLLVFFLMSLFSARSAVRLIMMLVPSASVIIAYFAIEPLSKSLKVKDPTLKIMVFIVVAVISLMTIFSAYNYYYAAVGTAQSSVPSIYTQQWQKAMAWVRESTPKNSVFGHWWDYGYWVQSIGERATVLDGGNAVSYWNHLMGRYALTGTNNTQALEFLYAHNTTHFLIDSSDIGKYGAFSSIGSDVDYDRASFIPTFTRDLSQSQEKKNSTVLVYVGGTGLDEDIIYDNNGTKIFLPAGVAGLGAILVEQISVGGEVVDQPEGIFVYQNQQYRLPLRYAYDGEFKDFGNGIEAGVFLIPSAKINGANIQLEEDGSLLYLSKRTVKSQLARLYLYKEDNPNFELVHSEDDFLIAQIKNQNPEFSHDFINYGGLRGPIRIWEIHYPSDIEFKKECLSTQYPTDIVYAK